MSEILEIEDIKKILPQRHPFLMIDRVIEASPKKVVAIKNVSINEEYFKGHFPGKPVMPGALIIEAMAQAGSLLHYYKFKKIMIFYLAKVKVSFLNSVYPGDQIKIIAIPIKIISNKGLVNVNVFTINKKISEAEISFSVK